MHGHVSELFKELDEEQDTRLDAIEIPSFRANQEYFLSTCCSTIKYSELHSALYY